MQTPVGALGRGLVAGAIGTGVMTGYQILVARLRAGDQEEAGDDGPPADPWEEAPAPALVAKRVIEGVFRREVSPDRIGLLTNATHWAYGVGWGGLYGLMAGSARGSRPLRDGLAFGAGVWGASYATLVPMGIYEPPWDYPASELALDASYHLAYGLGVAGAWRALGG